MEGGYPPWDPGPMGPLPLDMDGFGFLTPLFLLRKAPPGPPPQSLRDHRGGLGQPLKDFHSSNPLVLAWQLCTGPRPHQCFTLFRGPILASLRMVL